MQSKSTLGSAQICVTDKKDSVSEAAHTPWTLLTQPLMGLGQETPQLPLSIAQQEWDEAAALPSVECLYHVLNTPTLQVPGPGGTPAFKGLGIA